MTESRQPFSKTDFDRLSWQNVIAQCSERECFKYAPHFIAKAREAEASQDNVAREIYLLVAAIAGLSFHLDTPQEPFTPNAVVDGLGDGTLDTLRELAPTVADADMRARVADLLWIRRRDFRMAQLAVASYLESARVVEDPQYWVGCAARLERAFQVAAQFNFKKKAYDDVVARIQETLDRLDGHDPLFLSSTLMELLQAQKEGDPAKYAALAEKAAHRAEANGAWHIAAKYWSVLAGWHRQAEDPIAERATWVQVAETSVKWSDAMIAGPNPSYLAACTHLQQAIEVYRNRVGRAHAEARMQELHKRLLAYGERIPQEMTPASATYDPTPLLEAAQRRVQGKPLQEALQELALIGSPEIPQHVPLLRKRVEELAQQFPIAHLFATALMTDDGRVMARKPSMLSNDPAEIEEAIRAEMFEQARWGQSVHAEAQVEPARQQIILEHNVRARDFAPFVVNNPFVPRGREDIYARGLHAGLTGDLLVAGHLLIPQLENSIRTLLQRQGKITSNLTTEGVQDQFTLTKIFQEHHEDVAAILGEDLAFDLRGLLVERFGSNLRNEASHGLLNAASFSTTAMLYLWWLSLHLCYRVMLASQKQQVADVGEMSSAAGADAQADASAADIGPIQAAPKPSSTSTADEG